MRRLGQVMVVLSFGIVALTIVAAEEKAQPTWQYVGAKKCKTCHNSAKKGGQFKIWTDGKHANAFATLATPEALKLAKEKGIENPQESPECLKCHVTGYGEPKEKFAATFVETLGVQCESCHGAGSGYYKKKPMKEIWAGTVTPETYGLHIPTAETCANCHNENSPSGKFVDWPADSAKIAHPVPPGADVGDDEETEG